MLITLEKSDLKECLREVGVARFADRHKITEKVLEQRNVKPPMATTHKGKSKVSPVENFIVEENQVDTLLETLELDEVSDMAKDDEEEIMMDTESEITMHTGSAKCDLCENSFQHL